MDVFRNVAGVDFVCKLWFIFMRCYLKMFFLITAIAFTSNFS